MITYVSADGFGSIVDGGFAALGLLVLLFPLAFLNAGAFAVVNVYGDPSLLLFSIV